MQCRAANAALGRAWRRGAAVAAWNGAAPVWVPPDGTRRRLQALAAAGWSTTELAAQLGISRSGIAHLRNVDQERILARTAADVTALYERLWWRTAPASRAELFAEHRGWVQPWRWDGVDIDDPGAKPLPDKAILDEIAISEAAAGRSVALTSAELHALEQLLEEHGRSADTIAQLTGRSARTIQQHRSAARTAA